ncbi:hypothetical protein EBT31_14255 [bacterium]|jgi:hypothetical protein|nr:hypothetical protein [bacterium]
MYFVKIENNEVTQCWDTQPPRGEAGWKSAIEVRPAITPHRQMYTSHSFDITKDPVEIVWGVQDITPEDRKGGMRSQAAAAFQQVVQEEMRKEVDQFPETQYNPATVDAARVVFENKVTAINAATTHEQLDALM